MLSGTILGRMITSSRLAAICLLLSSVTTKAVEKPFHWQWRKMDDSFWQRPILRQMKVKNDDRVAIIDAVASSLKKDDGGLRDLGDADLYDLASNESYEWADLDGDGAPELITMTFGADTCGAVGNCILQVFRRHGTKLELVLITGAQYLMVDRSGTKPLLVLYTHESATEGDIAVYSFPRRSNATFEYHYNVSWAPLDGSGSAYSQPHLDTLPLTR